MNRKEADRLNHQEHTMRALGFTTEEARALRRISNTLRRWYELECGTNEGCIERDDTTGKPFIVKEHANDRRRFPIADRETGAVKRLRAIIHARNIRQPRAEDPLMSYYLQTDPRGAALYILRPQDVPEGCRAESCYTNGICIY